MNLFLNFGSIGSFFTEIWYTLMLWINNMIYNAIELFYKVFVTVANTNLFSETAFSEITSRMYVVMGIAMLFIFAYNIVLMIINPEDRKSSGNTGKIVSETIISLILVILLPTIFNYMAILQKQILDSQILSQIIVGDSGGSTDDCNYDNYTIIDNYDIDTYHSGSATPTQSLKDACLDYMSLPSSIRGARSVIPTLFGAFYHPVDYGFYECKDFVENNNTTIISDDKDKEMCAHYYYVIRMSTFKGSINPINDDSTFFSEARTDDGMFEFNWILSTIAGAFAAYMFASYAMAVGVRIAKLGFLQIISPIAVMLRIIPKQKDKIYAKWFKQITDTYLDIFVRLVIIYFSLFAISLVPDIIDQLSVNAERQPMVWILSKAIVILGVLKFAGDAPALFKEFFGETGKFALKSPKKQIQENKVAKGLAGSLLTAGHITAKNIYDVKKGQKIRPIRGISQVFGGLKGGYGAGAEANSLDDMRKRVYTAAKQEMTKPTLKDVAKNYVNDIKDPIRHYYGANYEPFNSKEAEKQTKKLDEVKKALENIESYLDKKDDVKAIDATYEGLIKKASENGVVYRADGTAINRDSNPAEFAQRMSELQKEWREEKHKARGRALRTQLTSDSGDELLKNYLDTYRSKVKEHKSIVNEALGKYNIAALDDINVELSNERFMEEYAKARAAGAKSGDYSQALSEQIIKQQENAKKE